MVEKDENQGGEAADNMDTACAGKIVHVHLNK